MKNIFSIFFYFLLSNFLFAQTNSALLDSGNTAYSKNKFNQALKYYEQIVANGYESTELYFNLGNAHYKSGHLAKAILYYEKAKKISPNDEDILYNLKLVNKQLVDKIEPLPELFINDWWNNLLLTFPEKTWSLVAITFIWISFIFLLLYFIANKRSIRQSGFFISSIGFALSLLTLTIAYKSKKINLSHNEAIVVSLNVTVKGSPSDQGTNLFVLHEGAKAKIEQISGDWVEIKIANGNRGWIKTVDLEVI